MSAEPSKIEYALSAELIGSQGGVNVLLFSKDGRILVSGGDDQRVRVWNTETYKCEQVLHNNKWGQITTLSWISPPPHAEKNVTSICVGTGRGGLYLCPMAAGSTWFSMKNANAFSVFKLDDIVETQAYDPSNQRLAVASHSGEIKMYAVENCLTLTELWSAKFDNGVPRSLRFFGGANQSLLIHCLETGEMSCRDAQTSTIMWSKILAGGIGTATLSSDETHLLVDNLTTGMFDLYHFPASTPSATFSLTATRRFIKQCVFAEGGQVAVCGSDSRRVQVVDLITGKPIQCLETNQERGMIQTIAAATVNGNTHLIAGGTTNGPPAIYIWHKKPPKSVATRMDTESNVNGSTVKASQIFTKQSTINCALALLIMLVSYPNWSPFFWKNISLSSTTLAHGANFVARCSSVANVDTGVAVDMLGGINEVDRFVEGGGDILARTAATDASEVLRGAVEDSGAMLEPENVICL